MGVFSTWQPIYAEAGLVTFPVHGDEKRPAVGNYLKAGRKASDEWAAKFGSAAALGLACGKRNGLTVLDIDAPDENLLADALSVFGPSPLVVRTASGKWHAWYKHNGEGRMIRTAMPGHPVDVLGNGYAIAPPSRLSKGAYQFVAGSLKDIASLPPMRIPGRDKAACEGAGIDAAAPVGERNDAMFKALMSAALTCATVDHLVDAADAFNRANLAKPLPAEELVKLVGNVWAKTQRGENWFGKGQRIQLSHDDVDRLLALGSDATALALKLRRHHWSRDFTVANAMRVAMPDGVWSERRFVAARAQLVDAGELCVVRAPSKQHGPGVYRFGKIAHGGYRGEKGGGV